MYIYVTDIYRRLIRRCNFLCIYIQVQTPSSPFFLFLNFCGENGETSGWFVPGGKGFVPGGKGLPSCEGTQ